LPETNPEILHATKVRLKFRFAIRVNPLRLFVQLQADQHRRVLYMTTKSANMRVARFFLLKIRLLGAVMRQLCFHSVPGRINRYTSGQQILATIACCVYCTICCFRPSVHCVRTLLTTGSHLQLSKYTKTRATGLAVVT
jgi:hypothetical protein